MSYGPNLTELFARAATIRRSHPERRAIRRRCRSSSRRASIWSSIARPRGPSGSNFPSRCCCAQTSSSNDAAPAAVRQVCDPDHGAGGRCAARQRGNRDLLLGSAAPGDAGRGSARQGRSRGVQRVALCRRSGTPDRRGDHAGVGHGGLRAGKAAHRLPQAAASRARDHDAALRSTGRDSSAFRCRDWTPIGWTARSISRAIPASSRRTTAGFISARFTSSSRPSHT